MNEFGDCAACGAPLHNPLATYCKRCKKLIDRVDIRGKHDKSARERALKEAWDGQAFRCYYTGINRSDEIPDITLTSNETRSVEHTGISCH